MVGGPPKQFTDRTCASYNIRWQNLINDSFLYSGDLLTLQMLWEVTISIWMRGTCHITSYSFYLSRTAAAPLHHQSCLPLTSFTQHLAPLIFSLFFTLLHCYHVHSFSFLFILSYSSTVSMPEFDFWLRITLPSASAPHRTSQHLIQGALTLSKNHPHSQTFLLLKTIFG